MREHREQLVIYLDSLKQALSSLDRLASLEPTPNEVHLANMKYCSKGMHLPERSLIVFVESIQSNRKVDNSVH